MMKIKLNSTRAFTALELVLVIATLVSLALFVMPALFGGGGGKRDSRFQCVNNLKQVGTAYRIWSNDNGDHYPVDLKSSSTNGGWGEFASMTNAGKHCWIDYTSIQNELGQSPQVLICPHDERKPAKNFTQLKNANISYFVGVGANENYPQSILGGDRNMSPGLKGKNDYGFSPDDGTGNDVIIQTNAPICWSLKMHSAGNEVGAGNILLGDGSVQQCSSARLRIDYQVNALDAGNFPAGYVNRSNSFRLVFP
jgi:type II secretory pathway pseudopilin PulG